MRRSPARTIAFLLVTALLAAALARSFGPLLRYRSITLTFESATTAPCVVSWSTPTGPDSGVRIPPGRTGATFPFPARAVHAILPHNTPAISAAQLHDHAPLGTRTTNLAVPANVTSPIQVPADVISEFIDWLATWAVIAGASLLARWWWKAPRREGPLPPARLVRASIVVIGLVYAILAFACPLYFCPDSMDYSVLSLQWLRTGSTDVFNTWRLPGYPLLIMAFIAAKSYWAWSLAHSLAGFCVAIISGRIASHLVGGLGTGLTILLVGFNPIVLLWSRYAMPEIWAMLLCTIIAWLTLSIPREGLFARRAACWALIGLLAGASCYLRADLQVLLVLVPLAPLLGATPAAPRSQTIACSLAALLAGAATIAPWVARTRRLTGETSLVVGSGFSRAQAAWSGGLIDPDQPCFSDLQLDSLRAGPASLGPFEFLAIIDRSSLAGTSTDRHPWVAQNLRDDAVVAESVARRPDLAWRLRLKATASLLGVPIHSPGFAENAWWAGALTASANTRADNFWNSPEDYGHLPLADSHAIFDFAHRDTSAWNASIGPSVFRGLVRILPWARLLLTPAMLAWLVIPQLQARRDAGLMLLIGLAHATAIGVLLFTGIDRYQSPFEPWFVIAPVSLAATIARRLASSRT